MATSVVELSDPAVDPTLAGGSTLATECPNYVAFVKSATSIAKGEGFADIEALDVFRVHTLADGRLVLIFLPAHLPVDDERLLERATQYVFARMHQLVIVEQKEYTVLWLCNNDDDNSGNLPLSWWRRTYWHTPYNYQIKLIKLVVVHPAIAVRAKLLVISYLHSSYLMRHPFWEKLDYADRLEFLDEHVPISLIKTLPDAVKQWDKMLDRQMYASVIDQQKAMEAAKNGEAGGMPPPPMPGGFGGMAGAAGLMGGGMGGGMFGGGGIGGATSHGFGAAAGAGGLGGETSGAGEEDDERFTALPKRNWED